MSKLSPKLRIIVIVMAVIIMAVLVMKFLIPSSGNDLQLPSSVDGQIVKPQMPVAIKTDVYTNLTKKYEEAQLEKAKLTDGSYVPNIFANKKDDTSLSTEKTAATAEAPENFYANRGSPNTKDPETLQTIANSQIVQNNSNAIQNNSYTNAGMTKSLENLLKAWNTQDTSQTFTSSQNSVDGDKEMPTVDAQQTILIKAGDILFATINTAINSDQVGTPVLATIVTGKYRGAKLLGSFQLADDRLVVHFNLMSIPEQSQSLSIDAYAVDENTAQASLSGEVNHHYLLRYGSLFAAAFLQGFGTYFANNNNTNVVCSKDSVICEQSQLNTSARDAAFSGLGQVGSALGTSVQQQFSRPVTVKLAQGTGLGVLFMNDVEPFGLDDTQKDISTTSAHSSMIVKS